MSKKWREYMAGEIAKEKVATAIKTGNAHDRMSAESAIQLIEQDRKHHFSSIITYELKKKLKEGIK